VGAIGFAMASIYIHDQAKIVPRSVNLHYSYYGHILLASLFSQYSHPIIIFESISVYHVFLFVCMIAMSLLFQNLLFLAVSLQKPSNILPFGYCGVLVSFLADVYYFHTSFSLLSVVGMLLTSIGLLGKLFTHQEPAQVLYKK